MYEKALALKRLDLPGSDTIAELSYAQEEKEVQPFLAYSLPTVNKYYPFADNLALPFVHPLEVVTVTNKGKEIINEREDISVCVANDTVPVGRILHLELGSSMYGRLSFPKNVRPVSPMLWICPQEYIPLQKPIKITLPHTVKYEEGTSELMFMKVHHETPLMMPTNTEYKFEFEEIVHHEGVEFNERNGSIFTKQFCTVCIVEKIDKPSPKRYWLLRTHPQNRNTSVLSVDYCVIYTLKTCLKTFRDYCTKNKLEVRHDWPEFTFTSDGMELTKPQATSGPTSDWIVEIESRKYRIQESEVDFWQYDVGMLTLLQDMRRYPPKITIDLHRNRAADSCTLDVHFSGTSPTLEDSIVYIVPSYKGKDTPEYNALLKNLSNITATLQNIPESKDLLCLKFMEKEWLEITANPSEKDLVILALRRTDADSHTFHEFVEMLKKIRGMDLVVQNLTMKLEENLN